MRHDTQLVTRIVGVSYGAAIAGTVFYLFSPASDGTAAALPAVGMSIIAGTLLGARKEGVRRVLRWLATTHLALAVFAVRLVWREHDLDLSFLALYLALNVTLPGLVVGLLPAKNARPDEDLPIGYQHVGAGQPRLSAPERVGLVLAMTLAIPGFMMGGAFLTIAWLPVAFGAFWIVRILRTRRDPAPTAERRLRLSPKMTKPAQRKGYWTVNSAEFDDPDLYKQD